MTADLIAQARAGDGEAFRQLTDPHRRELQVHCYRILGSLQDAEDALRDTLLAAWQGLGTFEGRASIRTWLYRVATSRCLNALRSASRPAVDWRVLDVEPLEPTRLGEVVWLEPYPDVLLEGLAANRPGPEARYEASEAISLPFVTALQLLPPRQRAVLILRDVLSAQYDVEQIGLACRVRMAVGPPRRAASQDDCLIDRVASSSRATTRATGQPRVAGHLSPRRQPLR